MRILIPVFILAALAIGATPDSGPTATQPWTVSLSSVVTLPMSWIPPGTFTMGSPESEPGRHPDETEHQVRLTHGYWMGQTEVTIAQWRAVMGTDLRAHLAQVIADDTLYNFPDKTSSDRKRTIRDFMGMNATGDIGRYLANEDDMLPMYFVNWNDAIELCARLTQREREAGRLPAGYQYSLPTEAQWEYAARAGTKEATFAGPLPANADAADVIGDIAWYSANSSKDYAGKGLGRGAPTGPHTAGVKKANQWGLRDMSGNLWEWCSDWYGPYPTGSVTDPKGPDTGTFRVNRGGSFGSTPASVRSANRATNPQAEASAYRGFRLALTYAD